jgi:phage tail protein X
MSLAEAAPLLAGGVISIVLPDNTAAKQQAEDLARDVVGKPSSSPGASA